MIARTYAVMAAGLTAWLMFIVYSQEMVQAGNYVSFQLDEPLLLIGLLIGGLLPYLFKSFSWRAALRVSRKCGQSYLKKEAGTGLFAYEQCVLSGVKGSLVGMIWPVLLALLAPIAFWFLGSFVGGNINQKLLGSLLIGSIISGFLMTLSMVIGGSAQNNSQKSVKTDNSDEAITIGPAISSLIKMLNIIALLIIGLLML
jgi:K(+)-stimulated pyrophosphate-energized sodium pump